MKLVVVKPVGLGTMEVPVHEQDSSDVKYIPVPAIILEGAGKVFSCPSRPEAARDIAAAIEGGEKTVIVGLGEAVPLELLNSLRDLGWELISVCFEEKPLLVTLRWKQEASGKIVETSCSGGAGIYLALLSKVPLYATEDFLSGFGVSKKEVAKKVAEMEQKGTKRALEEMDEETLERLKV